MFEAVFSDGNVGLSASFDSSSPMSAEFQRYMVVTPRIVHENTTALWNEDPEFIGDKGHLYVYTDYVEKDGEIIPGFKFGDGVSFLKDLPFVAGNGGVSGGGVAPGGNAGDIFIKRSSVDGDAEWVPPASSVEQDNTRPITSAAVYTEIGNINALLATI